MLVAMKRPSWIRTVLAGGAGLTGAILATALLAPAVAGATDVSSNWAGYVAQPSPSGGSSFSSVSGSWTEPSATCERSRESYSAVWVGLGGFREDAGGLEQLGTDADCSSAGKVSYSSWFELLPAEAITVHLTVRPGNRMTASVTVRDHDVTLRLRDLSTGARFSITRRAPDVDISSAEWIVEAPSVCASAGGCRTLALTDFGEVAFSSASATSLGHTGPISDPAWSATALELRQNALPSTARARDGAALSRGQPGPRHPQPHRRCAERLHRRLAGTGGRGRTAGGSDAARVQRGSWVGGRGVSLGARAAPAPAGQARRSPRPGSRRRDHAQARSLR